jgi:hypothetical protein
VPVKKDMDVNEHDKLFNITLRNQLKVEEKFILRKDMDVNEHD